MSQPILINAKLSIPNLISSAIPRKRLLQLLDTGKSKRLTIVRAPAGYGKTSLLSQWAFHSKKRIAWVSLDYSDNDPIRFWQSITKAVGAVLKTDLYENLLPLFNLQPRVAIELFVDLIRNEINKNTSEIQLILDDYQAITHSVIHRSVTRFINYLPKNSRVIISSSNELPMPILKWKEDSYVQEIDATKIKFMYKETALYLAEKTLPSKDLNTVHEIHKKSEGWPAGIKVVADIFENKGIESIRSNDFGGENPYISNYLFHELVTTLSQEEQEFLVRTSVLRFLDPDLCTKLTGHTNSAEMLTTFEERGLFICKVDHKESVFRFHQLFSDFLIRELYLRKSLTEIQSLYSIAALTLYERKDLLNAIEVALRGDLFDLAIKWIDEHALYVLALGQTETFVGWVDKLVRKKQNINPGTIAMFAFAIAMLGDFGRSLQLIQQLETKNEVDQWVTHKDYQTEANDFLGIKAYILLVGLNDIEESMRLMVMRLENNAKDSKFDTIPIRYNLFNPVLLRTKIGVNGKLWSEEVITSFFTDFNNTDYKNLNVAGYHLGVRAETLVERNRIDEALPKIKETIKIGRYFEDLGLLVPMFILKIQIQLSQKHISEAEKLVERIEGYVLEYSEHQWMQSIHAMKAKVYIQQNNIEEAEHELNKGKISDQYIGGTENEFWWFVHVRLLIIKKEYKLGLQTISQIKQVAKEELQISTAIEASLLEAILHKLAGNSRLALDALHESLEFGYPYGYIRLFINESEIFPLVQKYVNLRKNRQILNWSNVPLDYLETIMEAFNQERLSLSQTEGENPLNELTPREFEVLQHLTTGLSNREIAEILYLSPGTVRIYLSNIYAKLQVKTRTQAVLVAKDYS